MSTIRFSNSNVLGFVRLEDYTLLQSDTTRLSNDFVYQSLVNPDYNLKIVNTDTLWVQFRTDYDSIKAYLVSSAGVEVEVTTSLASGLALSDGRVQYELSLNISSYTGYYYLRFDFDSDYFKPIATFQSQWFESAASYTNHLKIEWMNGDYYPYDDGIIWAGITQKLYIPSRVSDYMVGVEKSVFTTSNNKLKTTYAQPTKSKLWQLELIPDYVYELLNNALAHDYFYINSVRYNTEETFEIERQGDTRLYASELLLRIVEDSTGNAFEDYSIDQELTGTLPVPDAAFILINATDNILINATDIIKQTS